MFFALQAVDDHPCCRMQEAVEVFFLTSVSVRVFSLNLFPEWLRKTLKKRTCQLGGKFSAVHTLLHAGGMISQQRRAIYDELCLTNRIDALCDGTQQIPPSVVNWGSPLGVAIIALMESLYEALDLKVFRRGNDDVQPTHEFYSEFIKKNKYVCPFCGLNRFKSRNGLRREDFDHYLNKLRYPLAAANMRNLVPTCGTCNQDYKAAKDILADGAAFYPYAAAIPPVKVEVDCSAYPSPKKFDDYGRWSVKLELVTPDATVALKMSAWDRVYSIKRRIEDAVQECFDEWMKQVSDDHDAAVDKVQFRELIESARRQACIRSRRRMVPREIVKAAFYEFVLNKANPAFVESYRQLQNRSRA